MAEFDPGTVSVFTLADMTIQRMDNVSVVVDDLEAVTSFFVELGMELEGGGTVEGKWVDRIVGLEGVRNDIAMLRTPDGHGGLDLIKFHTGSERKRAERAATRIIERSPVR